MAMSTAIWRVAKNVQKSEKVGYMASGGDDGQELEYYDKHQNEMAIFILLSVLLFYCVVICCISGIQPSFMRCILVEALSLNALKVSVILYENAGKNVTI